MKCKFVVGQKVVCVHELRWRCAGGRPVEKSSPVKVGGVYTITAINAYYYDEVALAFKEFPGDEWFAYTAFKPLEERKTDISVFTRMLNTKQKGLIDG